jgi:hypothetical protein
MATHDRPSDDLGPGLSAAAWSGLGVTARWRPICSHILLPRRAWSGMKSGVRPGSRTIGCIEVIGAAVHDRIARWWLGGETGGRSSAASLAKLSGYLRLEPVERVIRLGRWCFGVVADDELLNTRLLV